ncbi:MAG: N-acetylglucosamine-6-phosphate deacetylase [Pigmentiphaga sp.]|nr:N-acetylglucosamine-6-phosphate deacetylase [Pigmentiphaga sp.]
MNEQIKINNMISFFGNIITHTQIIRAYITIQNGKITAITKSKPMGEIIDLGDAYIAPGFIDLHIHGVHRALVDNGIEDLKEICKTLPTYGVTGFLPTLAPRIKGEDAKFLQTLAQAETTGTQILGFHLEGPFLKITGSLTADAVSGADASRVRALIEAAKPHKAIFSISPDVEDIDKLIPIMSENDTPVFITHTAADVVQTERAIVLGACHATHFYDVFPCPEVTEPGVRPCGAVEAILADDRVSVDFILDGVHVDPVAVRMALKCKPDKVCLITDANVGAGLEPGRFVFGDSGEIEFAYKGAPARSVQGKYLAGSGLTMDQALRNAMKWLQLDLPEAVQLLTYNPAKVLGISNHKGLLAAGYDADLIVLNSELEILQTWINGKCFYKKK